MLATFLDDDHMPTRILWLLCQYAVSRGRWSRKERERWIAAVTAILDLFYGQEETQP